MEYVAIKSTCEELLALSRVVDSRIARCRFGSAAYLNLTAIQLTLSMLAVGLASATPGGVNPAPVPVDLPEQL